MSCDDGVTWINDRSDNDSARCWTDGDPNNVECDHNTGSAVGLDAGSDGWVYAQFGWGYDGSVRKSRDGKNWQTVRANGWGGGLAVTNNVVFSYWEVNGATSKDQGLTWQPTAAINVWDIMDHGAVRRAGQKMIIKGRKDGELFISSDNGATWKRSLSFISNWGSSFAEGNGVLIAQGGKGFSARSTDGGMTWAAQDVTAGQDWNGKPLFNGTHFVNWSNGFMWKSTDGVVWTSMAYKVDGVTPPWWYSFQVAYNPATGTYAAALDVWGNYYTKQKMFRSTDGINWTTLNSTKFKGGHPLNYMITADVDAAACGQ